MKKKKIIFLKFLRFFFFSIDLGIISPVSDSYGKAGLVPIEYRLEMLRASIDEKNWIRVDPWESEQKQWTRTRIVLAHHHEQVKSKFGESTGIRYLAGADVVRSMLNANVWLSQDIDDIMTFYGVACITRLSAPESGPAGPTIPDVKEGMSDLWKENIDVIQDWVVNDISATNIRKQLATGRSVKYVVPDGAIDVIYRRGLYKTDQIQRLADWPERKEF